MTKTWTEVQAWTFEVWVTDPNTGNEKRVGKFARYEDAARRVNRLVERNPWLGYDIIKRYI